LEFLWNDASPPADPGIGYVGGNAGTWQDLIRLNCSLEDSFGRQYDPALLSFTPGNDVQLQTVTSNQWELYTIESSEVFPTYFVLNVTRKDGVNYNATQDELCELRFLPNLEF
jgi:hypothetical protein